MTVINQSIVSKVIKSFEGEAKKIAAIRADQDKAIQAALDAMVIACDKPKAEFLKGNAKTNEARGQIKAMFDAIVGPACSKASAASYQTAFWIAFETGVPFSRDLNNKKTESKKSGGAGGESDSKAKTGTVTTTTVAELHKTLSKALAQARILNQSIFAADLVDLIADTWPDFKETILAK